MHISIIIPVLNDSARLENLLSTLQKSRQDVELIVVDGGSTDNSWQVAAKYTTKILKTDQGRAVQMNAGAQIATGQRLWFLHADSVLDDSGLDDYLTVIMAHDWGRFAVRLSGQSYLLRIIAKLMNYRSCLTSIATGDQGIFVLRSLFEKVGGFPSQPLMEDIELSKKLKTVRNIACINQPFIITSSRKWQEQGVWRTIFLMWWLRLQYYLGVQADKLYSQYYKTR